MKIICTFFLLSVMLPCCVNNTSSKIEKVVLIEKPKDLKWLEKKPDFSVNYSTGYSEGDRVLIPGDFYLETNYAPENIEDFRELTGLEVCQLLDNPITRTNCILLLNEVNLVSNLEYQDATYEEWDSSIALKQLTMWKGKYGCEK